MVNCSNELDQIFYLKKFIKEFQGNVVVIGFEEHKDKIVLDEDRFISIGSKENLDEFAKNIYSALRKADRIKPKIIIFPNFLIPGL